MVAAPEPLMTSLRSSRDLVEDSETATDCRTSADEGFGLVRSNSGLVCQVEVAPLLMWRSRCVSGMPVYLGS